ncbi:Uma2 family endonuclease [Nocardiopsis sp. FIRDI 009]|uniref:Uma2 family endonuclease n=1 Tax=Nocardiopsis sp. FIRDI 009 TaxID=714197 RepID=UPI001E599C99|nr:Uma2 family endonuclease [Nocardiopsis sp. FIRDI 009]
MVDLPTLAENLELPEGYRTEIIDGSIVVSPTPSYRHADIVTVLHEDLIRAGLTDLRALQVVTVEVPKTGDRYVPDLAVIPTSVVRGEGGRSGPDWIRSAEDLELAVEVVSPSSSLHDWEAKVRGYAQAGVPLYLVVDPRKGEIALFSNPHKGQYRDVARALQDESVKLPEPFGIEIKVKSLFS